MLEVILDTLGAYSWQYYFEVNNMKQTKVEFEEECDVDFNWDIKINIYSIIKSIFIEFLQYAWHCSGWGHISKFLFCGAHNMICEKIWWYYPGLGLFKANIKINQLKYFFKPLV